MNLVPHTNYRASMFSIVSVYDANGDLYLTKAPGWPYQWVMPRAHESYPLCSAWGAVNVCRYSLLPPTCLIT